MRYPGGKNSGGTWRRIVNQIPPHDVYIEPFLGSGAILRHKRPALKSFAVDLDQRSIDLVRPQAPPNTVFHAADGIRFLRGDLCQFGGPVFIYCDPPYLRATRRDPNRRYYQHDMTPRDHEQLLLTLLRLQEHWIMISGYQSALYDRMLKGWRRETYGVQTRGGPAVEVLWMNYPAPIELHDDRWIGRDWRGRLDFHRLVQRWTRRFEALDPIKRAAVLAALVATNGKSAAAAGDRGGTAKGGSRRSRSTPGGPTAAVLPGGSTAARGG